MDKYREDIVFSIAWFEKYQSRLLWLLNNKYTKYFFRKLIGVTKKYSKVDIFKITPNAIHTVLDKKKDKTTYVAEFVCGPLYADRLKIYAKPFFWLLHNWDMRVANKFFPNWNLGFDTTDFLIQNGADDGYVYGYNVDYATANANYAAASAGQANWSVGRIVSGGTYYIYQGLVNWLTSSLPDSATVSAATFSCAVTTNTYGDGRNITAEWYVHGDTIGSGDWEANGTGTNALSGAQSSGVGSFSLSNLSNISKTGKTGLRFFIDGGQPANSNEVAYIAYDSNTTNCAKLSVTYATGSSSNSPSLSPSSSNSPSLSPSSSNSPSRSPSSSNSPSKSPSSSNSPSTSSSNSSSASSSNSPSLSPSSSNSPSTSSSNSSSASSSNSPSLSPSSSNSPSASSSNSPSLSPSSSNSPSNSSSNSPSYSPSSSNSPSTSPSPSPPQTRWWNPSTLALIKGSIVSGALSDIYLESSSANLVLSEVAGAYTDPVTGGGFTYDFEYGIYEDVPTNEVELDFRGFYNGNPAHNIKLQQWNYNTSAWDNVTTNSNDFPSGSVETQIIFHLIWDANHISSGNIKLRVIHLSTGIGTHVFNINKLYLEFPGSPSSSNSPSESPSTSSSNSPSYSPSSSNSPSTSSSNSPSESPSISPSSSVSPSMSPSSSESPSYSPSSSLSPSSSESPSLSPSSSESQSLSPSSSESPSLSPSSSESPSASSSNSPSLSPSSSNSPSESPSNSPSYSPSSSNSPSASSSNSPSLSPSSSNSPSYSPSSSESPSVSSSNSPSLSPSSSNSPSYSPSSSNSPSESPSYSPSSSNSPSLSPSSSNSPSLSPSSSNSPSNSSSNSPSLSPSASNSPSPSPEGIAIMRSNQQNYPQALDSDQQEYPLGMDDKTIM